MGHAAFALRWDAGGTEQVNFRLVAPANASVLPEDDATLARRAASGDREAFGRLYAKYSGTVHGVLLSRVSPSDAGDLVQDVFLQALEQLATLREPGAFGGWLMVIARRRAADFHRARRETTSLPTELTTAGEASGDAEATVILDMIRELPEAYRETLIWRLVEGLTGPEIAERSGLTAASVRVNLHRGMGMLRERLGGSYHA